MKRITKIEEKTLKSEKSVLQYIAVYQLQVKNSLSALMHRKLIMKNISKRIIAGNMQDFIMMRVFQELKKNIVKVCLN